MIFVDFAETVLRERVEDGIRGSGKERNRFDLHVRTAPFTIEGRWS